MRVGVKKDRGKDQMRVGVQKNRGKDQIRLGRNKSVARWEATRVCSAQWCRLHAVYSRNKTRRVCACARAPDPAGYVRVRARVACARV